jgi:hypothetical protein
MAYTFKVLVTGPFSAGKSTFIKTISELAVVSTERKITRPGFASTVPAPRGLRVDANKSHTTVAMDYGRVTIGDDMLHLHGTPGQARFDFMWDVLSRDMAGYVLLVDSVNPDSFAETRAMHDYFLSRHKNVPFVVAANKQDAARAPKPETLRQPLNLSLDALIMPCVGTRRTSVKQVLVQLAQMM